MASQMSLSAAADERKARLAKLKSLKRKQPDDEALTTTTEPKTSASAAEAPDVSSIVLSGRNYDPETRGAKLGFEQPPTLGLEKPTLEEQAAEVEDEVRRKAAEDEQNDKSIDLFKLQPKKPNWDLKRDLDRKLEILDVRTNNAIARLVRERIALTKNTGQTEEGGALDGITLLEGVRQREKEDDDQRSLENEV